MSSDMHKRFDDEFLLRSNRKCSEFYGGVTPFLVKAFIEEEIRLVAKETYKFLNDKDVDCPDCPLEYNCNYENEGCIFGVHKEPN